MFLFLFLFVDDIRNCNSIRYEISCVLSTKNFNKVDAAIDCVHFQVREGDLGDFGARARANSSLAPLARATELSARARATLVAAALRGPVVVVGC